jgi:uncharacterized protein (TIGR02246 family)
MNIMKNYTTLIIASIVFLMIFPSCQTTQVDIQAEKDAIQNLTKIWNESIKNKNVDAMRDLMAEDVVFLIDDIPIIEGWEALRQAQSSWYADTSIDFSTYRSEIVDSRISEAGDLAIFLGIEVYMQLTPEGIKDRRSKFLDIWEKTDGQWKVIMVASNSDSPWD